LQLRGVKGDSSLAGNRLPNLIKKKVLIIMMNTDITTYQSKKLRACQFNSSTHAASPKPQEELEAVTLKLPPF